MGTNSKGAVSYTDCGTFQFGKLKACIAHKKNSLPKRNFLEEGKGYAPDIYANTVSQLYKKLDNLGVELSGIQFNQVNI